MKNWLSNTWNNIKSNTVDKAHSLFTGVRSKFTSLWNATKRYIYKIKKLDDKHLEFYQKIIQ